MFTQVEAGSWVFHFCSSRTCCWIFCICETLISSVNSQCFCNGTLSLPCGRGSTVTNFAYCNWSKGQVNQRPKSARGTLCSCHSSSPALLRVSDVKRFTCNTPMIAPPILPEAFGYLRWWYLIGGPSCHGQFCLSAARLTSLTKNSSISFSFFWSSRLCTLRPASNLGSCTSFQN